MLTKKYLAEVVSIKHPLEGVFTVEFAAVQSHFRYAPGQFLHLALDEYVASMPWPDSRCFSIQSSPDEPNLRITYAVKGDFTRRMEAELACGRTVWLKMPYGDLFSREHGKVGAVFVSGGTGITPYLSLFTSSVFAEYQDAKLFAGFRSKSYNVYHDELEHAKAINPTFSITEIDEDTDGILDVAGIVEGNRNSGGFFLSGPPAMLEAFKGQLAKSGIDASMVHADDWQ